MLKLKTENIPESMKIKKQWVAFKIRDGKKIPIDPKSESDYETASISDPNTWGTFEEAARLVEQGIYPEGDRRSRSPSPEKKLSLQAMGDFGKLLGSC